MMNNNIFMEKHLGGLKPQTVKLKNNFVVSKFIVNASTDYAYSVVNEDEAFLLNVAQFGSIKLSEVRKIIEMGERVIIVHNESMSMYVYNIPEEVVISALFTQ